MGRYLKEKPRGMDLPLFLTLCPSNRGHESLSPARHPRRLIFPRSLLSTYQAQSRSTSGPRNGSGPLSRAYPWFPLLRCLQVENEHVLKSMKACVSETLSTLGQHFGQLLELALTREVQVSAAWDAERHSCGPCGERTEG